MKKLGLFVLLAFALAAGFAQTQFIAVYDFLVDDNNVTSFAYNGDTVNGLTMGPMVKQGVTSSTIYPGNFYATGWPTDTTPDLNKYMGFTMTAQSGYTFSVDRVFFGLGKCMNGPLHAQWRGSADNYAAPFDSYDSNLDDYYNPSILDLYYDTTRPHEDFPGSALLLSGVTDYQNITSCDLRMYMYESLQTDEQAGLWDRVMVIGTVQSAGGPALSTNPYNFTNLPSSQWIRYEWSNGPSAAKSFTVSGSGLTGPVQVFGSKGFEVAVNAAGPFGPTAEIPYSGGNVNQNVYFRLKKGLEDGFYFQEVLMLHSAATGYAFAAIATGSVDYTQFYTIDFERPEEVKPDYASGSVSLGEIEWNMTEAKIIESGSDPTNVIKGTRSAVLRGYGNSSMSMLEDYPRGSAEVRFGYRSYKDPTTQVYDTQVPWVLQYSTDGGSSWTQAGDPFTATSTVKYFSAEPAQTGPVRLRIQRQTPDASMDEHRIIIDEFSSFDYYDIYDTYVTIWEAPYEILLMGGYAALNPDATPSPIPNPDPSCIVGIHKCLTMFGAGPWGVRVYYSDYENPILTDHWAGYKHGNNWYIFDVPCDEYGSYMFMMPIYVVSRSTEIEVIAGHGRRPDTLPVTLSHFSATMTAENYVQLTWISQTETNVLGYNVYRSGDNNLNTAMQICPMIAATNTSEAQTYIYVDQDLVEDGTYYYWLQNVDMDGTSAFHGPASVIFSITGDGGSPAIPKVTRLENAYPNPFNPNTTLRYQLESPGNVKIDIYNTRGQIVRSFEQGHDVAGYYGILWDGCDSNGRALASGVYLYRMTSGNYVGTKKVVLQK